MMISCRVGLGEVGMCLTEIFRVVGGSQEAGLADVEVSSFYLARPRHSNNFRNKCTGPRKLHFVVLLECFESFRVFNRFAP